MSVSTTINAKEFESDGRTETEFVGLRYIGSSSSTWESGLAEASGYNGTPLFQRGIVYFAVLPEWNDREKIENDSMRVNRFENRTDFEVIRDPEEIADAFLSKNFLPEDVFHARDYDPFVREKVLEKLDLTEKSLPLIRSEDTDTKKTVRDRLGDLCDREEEETEEVDPRYQDYDRRFKRSDLQSLCSSLRENTEEINLQTAGRTEMLDYLLTYPPEEVESHT